MKLKFLSMGILGTLSPGCCCAGRMSAAWCFDGLHLLWALLGLLSLLLVFKQLGVVFLCVCVCVLKTFSSQWAESHWILLFCLFNKRFTYLVSLYRILIINTVINFCNSKTIFGSFLLVTSIHFVLNVSYATFICILFNIYSAAHFVMINDL